jgi:nucleotide-binding universal stress UspA family protein
MEKILLAINGITPDKKVFGYALNLCQSIKAELSVLQVISPRHYRRYLKKIREKAAYARAYIEGSMVAATFAESGDYETARTLMAHALKDLNDLLPESDKAGIRYQVTMKTGDPGQEIVQFVNAHSDVVLAIYDAVQEEDALGKVSGLRKPLHRKIKENLSVPLVVVHQ